MPDANETVEATLDRANKLFSSGLGGTLGILKAADADLSARLHELVKKQGPGAKQLRFTEAHALLYRKQIRLVNAYLEQRMLGHTHAQALKGVAAGVKSTTALAKKLEKQFTGIARPLALEQQQHQDSLLKGTGASLLRQHQTSVGRYGNAMIQDFERVMRVSTVAGLNQHQVISRLVTQGELGGINAKELHAKEPGYFPKPSGYVVRRYWAERIVRTETAFAMNSANQATIAMAKQLDFPDMQKKILAHFDLRTAPDSIAVHGQIRPVDGLFTDGAGRMYKHPPARPNDRETVIPWRPHWTELPATKQAPPEAIAAAKVEAQPAGLQPAGAGQILVPSSKAKIAGMVKKLKAEQKDQTQGVDKAQKYAAAQVAAARATLKGKKLVGMAVLADEQAIAKAAQLQAAKSAKLAKSPAELKAKAEAYKAEIAAKAAAKAAEIEAAKAAELKVKALKAIEAQKAIAGSPEALVANLKDLKKYQPALFEQVQKAAGVTVVHKSPKAAALHLAKKIAPEYDYASFKPKPKVKPVPPPPIVVPKAPEELPELEFKEVSGYIDIHDKKTGAKLAYLKPAAEGVSVTPPPTLTGFTAKTFATKEAGAAYAIEVSKAIQEQKALAALKAKAEAATHAELQAKLAAMSKAEKLAAKKEQLSKPVAMAWSDKWKPPARKPLELVKQSEAVDKGLSKKNRAGVAVAADADFVEDFQISFTTEIRQGVRETVARFRVNEHRAPEVLVELSKKGGKVDNFPGFPKLKGLDNPELEFASTHGEYQGKPPGVKMRQAEIRGTTVRFFQGDDANEHPAMKNLMEVRFEEPKGKGARWAKFQDAVTELGIKPNPPTPESIETYKRAKVLAVADKIGALQLNALKERTPEAVGKVWGQAVKRDPRLQEIADDAALREVAPGHYALYSSKLAERYRAVGITHLKHNLANAQQAIELMLADDEAGLLSSRERFQRGLVFRGMSTDSDFGTGGADSVFTRLAPGNAAHYGSGNVVIDHSELGRFDMYSFNADRYGRADEKNSGHRMRLSELEETMADDNLSSSNETMIRKTVPRWSIRKVSMSGQSKQQLVEALKKRGVTEVQGVPLEELITD